MKTYYKEEIEKLIPHLFKRPIATIGFFDGVHVGHQKLIQHVNNWAKEIDGESIIITFDKHPREVLRGNSPALITSLEQRVSLFSKEGVDVTIVIPFGQEWAEVSAEKFVRDFLKNMLGIKGIVIGFDFRFGHDREGNESLLQKLGKELDFEVQFHGSVFLESKQIISSTAIRKAVSQGNINVANAMLGRPLTLRGSVIRGDGRGRYLGFPTANLKLHHTLKPPSGVYKSRVFLNGRNYYALTNIGLCPTFSGNEEKIEVHILDFTGDLYGSVLDIEILEKIRDEKKFNSAEELSIQVQEDKKYLLSSLSTAEYSQIGLEVVIASSNQSK